jgi:hypothetical protein
MVKCIIYIKRHNLEPSIASTRKDVGINKHKRLSNITLSHKLKSSLNHKLK